MEFSGVSEAEWLRSFQGLPVWSAPATPMLIVSPHPDDETLGCGGLIAAERRRGAQVMVAAVTDGEHAYPGDEGGAPLGTTRRAEQERALARLGVSAENIVRLGLPDSDVGAHEAELVDRLMERATPEGCIVAPWEGDFHPDHEVCGRAAAQVAGRTGARLISYFFWTWHRGTPETLAGAHLSVFPLDEELARAKMEALECHRSQLQRAAGGPVLPPELLEPARRDFEVFWVR